MILKNRYLVKLEEVQRQLIREARIAACRGFVVVQELKAVTEARIAACREFVVRSARTQSSTRGLHCSLSWIRGSARTQSIPQLQDLQHNVRHDNQYESQWSLWYAWSRIIYPPTNPTALDSQNRIALWSNSRLTVVC